MSRKVYGKVHDSLSLGNLLREQQQELKRKRQEGLSDGAAHTKQGKWTYEQEAICAQCNKLDKEGMYEGGIFYCSECCDKRQQQADRESNKVIGYAAADGQFLLPYQNKWTELVEQEWLEELRIVGIRLNKWPLDRLVQQGFCITDVSAQKHGQFFGKAKIIFSKEILQRHQFSSGDEVIVSRTHPLKDKCAWKGELIEVGASRITVASDNVPYDISTGNWRLDCGANKIAYERTKSALGYITGPHFKPKAFRRLLLDENTSETKQLSDKCNLNLAEAAGVLDASQLAAIQQVQNEILGLIQGPPGTGKTTTTCHLIKAMVDRHGSRECSMLATADSNVAVDQLVEGLIKLGVKAVRIGFPSKVTEDSRSHTLLAKFENHPLAAKIEETRVSLQRIKDDLYGGRIKGKGKGQAHIDIQKHAKEIKQTEKKMAAELINSADVVCSTLVGCGSDALLQCRFPLVLIDEATQATEPRCLIALQKCQNQAILIGDQQQLPPLVVCAAAEHKGLKYSLFDRLLNSGVFQGQALMLKTQYRMHPLIRKWPSMHFYNDELLDGLHSEDAVPGFGRPLAYIDTSTGIGTLLLASSAEYFLTYTDCTNEESHHIDGSKYNLHEVELVRWCVDRLMWHLRPEDIGVISPYTAQISHIQAVFDSYAGKYHGVEVKTVDGFQGREKSAIVFSCVRTSGLGLLTDYRRLNVAITRAKRQLVLIGFGKLLAQDSTWSSYLHFLYHEGLVVQT